MKPATVAEVLAVAPPEWKDTPHGRRARGVVDAYVAWVLNHFLWAAPASAEEVFDPARLAIWTDVLRERTSLGPATINRHVAAVLSVWRRAYYRGLLGPPPSGLYSREPKGRRRVLSPEEEPRLLAALAEPYRSLAAFLLASGLRVGEALALEWRDITELPAKDARNVVVRDSKNGDARVVPGVRADVPMDPRTWRGKRGPFAEVSHSAFNHAFRAAKAAIGLEADAELVPHSLRHTYATRLVVAGVPLSVVARLLGHRTVRTTMRYSHVSDEDAARWVRQVSGKSA